MTHKSVKKIAFIGVLWNLIDAFGSQIINLGIQIALARLLAPSDFGILGMVAVFIAVSQMLVDSGLQVSLIRQKKVSRELYSTVFFFNIVFSIVLYAILFAIAPSVSRFYNQPILVEILRVFGLVLPINAFSLIQRVQLTRDMDFKSQASSNLVASISSGALAIVFAFKGFGVWSLVYQQVLYQLIQTVLLSLKNRWYPDFVFNRESFKEHFSFGWKLTGSALASTLYNNVYYITIGKYYSPTDLGYYTNAQKFNDVPAQSLTRAFQKMALPIMSQFSDDDTQLKRKYRSIIRYSSLVTFPVMLSLAAAAPYLIPFLFGHKWDPSVPYFQILSIIGLFYPINGINLDLLLVKGRSDLFFTLNLVKCGIGFAFITVAVFAKFSIVHLLWVGVLSATISTIINVYFSISIIGYTPKEQIKDVYKSLFSALAMMGTMIAVGMQIAGSPNVLILVLQYFLGLLVYLIFCRYIFRSDEVIEGIAILKRKLKRS